MSNETELANSIDIGRQAESIVNHPLLIAVIKSLREVAIEKFENLGFKDTEQMQECNQRLNLVEEFESNFYTLITNGNIAFKTLEDIQTFQQEIKNER